MSRARTSIGRVGDMTMRIALVLGLLAVLYPAFRVAGWVWPRLPDWLQVVFVLWGCALGFILLAFFLIGWSRANDPLPRRSPDRAGGPPAPSATTAPKRHLRTDDAAGSVARPSG